ncbi:hypothetical protein EIN_168880 [Entamoeba invadens IP1]|uniref:Membrane transport protein MMPL domain-containing protein n=1 Tax=Entamoeba invadens IP1 TaxID=370355 RepID=A0A0A1U0S5_ENTIV|nr:hypothetical protein EIN_168880 [Entamoeba invadens IP1]ELP84483.1 hypothetical protein EIN_168880 [Entamoeba invadens IP1]|eukprot:XP_004183829.1 hypothetical protein EIN_168880 [Entamoeba invadens IP1]
MKSFAEIRELFSSYASKSFDFTFKWIDKLKWLILIFWLVTTLGLAYCAFEFLMHTSMVVTAPKGTLAYTANALYKEQFPDISGRSEDALVIRQIEKNDDINNSTYLKEFSEYFVAKVYGDPHSNLVKKIAGRYIDQNSTTKIEEFVNGVTSLAMVSNDTTIIQIELSGDDPTAVAPLVKRMRKYISEYIDDVGAFGYTFDITGYDALGIDLQTVVIKALEKMDFCVLPIALLILLYVVQSPVLLVVPLCNILAIIVISFGLMYPLSLYVDIIATAVDYSLFLLTRFTEEINKQQNHYEAVKNMLRTSGRIVGTSGCVMLICFSVITLFPFDIIRWIGFGCTLCVATTLIVDLTMTPALFLCFPRFFRLQSCVPCSKKCVRYTQRRARFEGLGDKAWHWFATFQSKPIVSISMLIGGVVVLLPFCVFVYQFQWTLDNNQVVPMNTEFDEGFENLQHAFPIGVLYPFNLLVYDGKNKVDITSDLYYKFTEELVSGFSEEMPYGFNNNSMVTFNTAGGKVLSPNELKKLLQLEGYQNVIKNCVSGDLSVVKLLLTPTNDPTNNSTKFVADIREHLDYYIEKYGYSILIQGIIIDGVDCVNASMYYFIFILVILVVVVLLLVLIFFKSLLVALRVVFTTCLTIVFVYGCASMVFCNDYFDFIDSVEQTHGIYWVVPLISIPIICGLSLDYDIFLFSRIREYRERGYVTDIATIYGVERTGYLITFCGLIMAIAFSGLFLSGLLVLNLFAFVLTFSVLADTFIVRTLIVPSFVHLFKEFNWWPIKYKTDVFTYEEADEFHAYDHLDALDDDKHDISNAPKEESIQEPLLN